MPIQIGDGLTKSMVINLLEYRDSGSIMFAGSEGDGTQIIGLYDSIPH